MADSARGHLTAPAAALADRLPSWVTLVRAPNPGPMTLDGTNTWVLRAAPDAPAIVIDPGPADEGHLRAVAASGPVAGVLITHGHADHTDGLERFLALTGARRLNDPRDGHGDAGRDNRGGGHGGHGGHGDSGDSDGGHGGDSDGGRLGLSVTRLATPGHTADSVCFDVSVGGERVIFTGDTILGRGTTVVAWPDGDLGRYLDSLERLAAYQGIAALPGHGPALADCAAAARFYLAHRRARLDQVAAVVAAGAATPGEVVDRVYADVDDSLRAAAEWSVRAQLAYLARPAAGVPADRVESKPADVPLDQP